MALNFPDSPTLNQVYTDTTSGFSYQWDGVVWQSYTAAASKNISIIDNIENSFNGSTQTFSLVFQGTAFAPVNAQQLRVVLGGIVQEPLTDYTISGSNITFIIAPTSGLNCSIISLGPAHAQDHVTPIDGSVTPAKLSTGGPSWNTDGDVVITGTGSTALLVNGNARVTGILTVGSSSITIDGTTDEVRVGPSMAIGSSSISMDGMSIGSTGINIGGLSIGSTEINMSGMTISSSGINMSGGRSLISGVGIQSGGVAVGYGITTLNFVGTGNTFAVNGNRVDISISGGGGASSQLVTTAAGIHTLSNFGIGTTNPQYKLDVTGDINFTGTFRQNGSQFVASRWTSGTGDNIYRLNGDIGIGVESPTAKLDVNGVIKDSNGNVRAIPNNDKSGSYTLTASDIGELINITTGGVTVPASIFSAGNSITIYNNSASNQTITQGAGVTLRLAGTSTTGNRTLALRGIATIMCVGSNDFVISGAGLS